MYNYTYKQHFKFGYDADWFNPRWDKDSQWHVEYGSCEYRPTSFRDEVLRVARLVENESFRLGLPIDVMFSGGSESEMMLRSFTEQDIPVRVHIMRFKDGHNQHDIASAEQFIQTTGIVPQYHELDILKFWEKEAFDYAERARCVSPQLLSTMWLMDQLDGIPCLGSAECYLSYGDMAKYQYWDPEQGKLIREEIKSYPKRPWFMHEREKIAAWYRHAMLTDRPAVPGYFQYTPEVMLSFLEDPTTQSLVNCKMWGKLSNQSTKKQVYETYFPNMVQQKKTTGFESIMEQDAVIRRQLYSQWGSYSAEALTEYAELIKHLQGEHYE